MIFYMFLLVYNFGRSGVKIWAIVKISTKTKTGVQAGTEVEIQKMVNKKIEVLLSLVETPKVFQML